MPCRHAAGGDGDREIDADNFRATALAIGGQEALAALLEREGGLDHGGASDPGREQHDWTTDGDAGTERGAADCPAHETDGASGRERSAAPSDSGESEEVATAGSDGDGDAGCPVDHDEESTDDRRTAAERRSGPRYHLLLSLTPTSDPDPPTAETVETALSELESALGWGPDGVAFTMGYAPSYLNRADVSVPEPIRAAIPALANPSDRVVADGAGTTAGDRGLAEPTALLHLASDDARTLLAAELALWGAADPVDRSLSSTFEGVFERPRNPPGRRAAVASDDWTPPAGSPEIDCQEYEGAAIQRVRTVDHDGASEADGHSDDAGCPVDHDETAADGRDADRADEESPGGRLLGLDPAGPARIDVEYRTRAGDDGDVYVVPPRERRSFPGLQER